MLPRFQSNAAVNPQKEEKFRRPMGTIDQPERKNRPKEETIGGSRAGRDSFEVSVTGTRYISCSFEWKTD